MGKETLDFRRSSLNLKQLCDNDYEPDINKEELNKLRNISPDEFFELYKFSNLNLELSRAKFMEFATKMEKPDFDGLEGELHKKERIFWNKYKKDTFGVKTITELIIERINNMLIQIDNQIKENFEAELTDYITGIKYEVLRKWIDGKRSPRNRKDLFKISFAFDLPFAQKDENNEYPTFSHQGLFNKIFNQKFCLKTADELCMLYCKYNGLSYGDALSLYDGYLKEIKKLNGQSNQSDNCSTNVLIGTKVLSQSESDFLSMLVEIKDTLVPNEEMIINEINNYMSKMFEEQGKIEAFEKNFGSIKEDLVYDSLMEYDKTDSKSYFLNHISINPDLYKDEVTGDKECDKVKIYNDLFVDISGLMENKYKSTDVNHKQRYIKLRCSLITVYFFDYFIDQFYDNGRIKDNDSEISDGFTQGLKCVLCELNLPALYPYNSFDRFFLWCSKTKEPIKMYYSIIHKIVEFVYDEINKTK